MGLSDLLKGESDDSEISSLKDVLVDQLKDLYSAENQLLKALPKLEMRASSKALKQAFRSHIKETEVQVKRLEEMGSVLGEKLTGKTCKAMKGLIEEGEEAMEHESENAALIDSLLIGAAQRVEHYEMAAYGTSRAFAERLNETRIAKLLQQTLNEEGAADKKLTQISEREVLPSAFKGVSKKKAVKNSSSARAGRSAENGSQRRGTPARSKKSGSPKTASRAMRGGKSTKSSSRSKQGGARTQASRGE